MQSIAIAPQQAKSLALVRVSVQPLPPPPLLATPAGVHHVGRQRAPSSAERRRPAPRRHVCTYARMHVQGANSEQAGSGPWARCPDQYWCSMAHVGPDNNNNNNSSSSMECAAAHCYAYGRAAGRAAHTRPTSLSNAARRPHQTPHHAPDLQQKLKIKKKIAVFEPATQGAFSGNIAGDMCVRSKHQGSTSSLYTFVVT